MRLVLRVILRLLWFQCQIFNYIMRFCAASDVECVQVPCCQIEKGEGICGSFIVHALA